MSGGFFWFSIFAERRRAVFFRVLARPRAAPLSLPITAVELNRCSQKDSVTLQSALHGYLRTFTA
jgi:hypothetical protein